MIWRSSSAATLRTSNQQPEAPLDGDSIKSGYVAWLETQGIPVFKIRNQYWQRYREALVPATIAPNFVSLTEADAPGSVAGVRCVLCALLQQPKQRRD